MSFNIPNVFIAGKKAIADEVNENFEVVKDEINSHKSRIATLQNSVDSFDDALNGGLREDLTSLVKNAKAMFCANIGNVDENGDADLLAIDSVLSNNISFKVSAEDGNFSPITYTNYNGTTVKVEVFNPIDMNGLEDGTYIIYATPEGNVYASNGTLTRSKIMPEMNSGDIWLNLSRVPFEAKSYNGISHQEFLDTPIGEAVMASGALAEVKTYPYNQNGFDVNTQVAVGKTPLSDSIFHNSVPNYGSSVRKALGVQHTAEEHGYILFGIALVGNSSAKIVINGSGMTHTSTTGTRLGAYLYPAAKGTTYSVDANANLFWLSRLV